MKSTLDTSNDNSFQQYICDIKFYNTDWYIIMSGYVHEKRELTQLTVVENPIELIHQLLQPQGKKKSTIMKSKGDNQIKQIKRNFAPVVFVGPFRKLNDANKFKNLLSQDTRGVMSRTIKAEKLVNHLTNPKLVIGSNFKALFRNKNIHKHVKFVYDGNIHESTQMEIVNKN